LSSKWAKFDPRLKDIQFMDRKVTVCLDPADYLAFALRENIVDSDGKKAQASLPILVPFKKWRDGIFTRKQVSNMTERAIAAGQVPGAGPIQMTPDFATTLAQAGWSHRSIEKLATHLQSLRDPSYSLSQQPQLAL
jgi:predicted transport protein